jgi:hypothetical protein
VVKNRISRDSDSLGAQQENTQKGVYYTHIGYDLIVLEEKGDKKCL